MREEVYQEIMREEYKLAQPIQEQLIAKLEDFKDLTTQEIIERATEFIRDSSIIGFQETKSNVSISSDGTITVTVVKYDDSKWVEINFAPEQTMIIYLQQDFKHQSYKQCKPRGWRNEVWEMTGWLGFTFYR